MKWQFAIVDGQPESDQLRDSWIRTTCAQADPRAEAEAGSKQGNARKLGLEIIERGADVIFFPAPMIVVPLACAHAAKIETQNRNTQGVERLGSLVDNLVVHGPLIKRVRMTHHRGQVDLL